MYNSSNKFVVNTFWVHLVHHVRKFCLRGLVSHRAHDRTQFPCQDCTLSISVEHAERILKHWRSKGLFVIDIPCSILSIPTCKVVKTKDTLCVMHILLATVSDFTPSTWKRSIVYDLILYIIEWLSNLPVCPFLSSKQWQRHPSSSLEDKCRLTKTYLS